MASKIICFRLSGNKLDVAINSLGEDQIANKSRELLLDYLLANNPSSTDSTNNDSENSKKNQSDKLNQIDDLITDILARLDQLDSQLLPCNINQSPAIAGDTDILPERQISDLQSQIDDLYSRINHLEKNQSIHELKSSDRPAITELNSNEDQEMTANRFKPKSIRQQLLELIGGNSKDSREKIASKFKRLTAIAPASLEGGVSYEAMLKYLQDNPQYLAPKENQ